MQDFSYENELGERAGEINFLYIGSEEKFVFTLRQGEGGVLSFSYIVKGEIEETSLLLLEYMSFSVSDPFFPGLFIR